jgi:Uma2 family endonuclease
VPEAQDVLLLVEVSDSTLAFDQGEKLHLYARYSVTEYWVVDVNKQLVVRYLDPTAQGYARQEEYKGADDLGVKAFPQLLIAVKDILG